MKRKYFFIIGLAIVLVLGITLLASGQTLWQEIGQREVQAENDNEMTVIAFIQGEEFAVNSGYLENAYYYYQRTQEPMNEAEVREFYVANELLYREAQAQGLSAGPEEVNAYIAELRENLSDDPEGYAELSDYLGGLGITEDEYWETHLEDYQKELTIEKLGDKLLDNYFSQYPDATADEYQEYYRNEYRPWLFDKYQVEML